MTLDPHFGIKLKAELVPTESVLCIAELSGSVTRYFPYSEVIRIELSEAGFARLCGFIEKSYAIDEAGLIQSLQVIQARPSEPE